MSGAKRIGFVGLGKIGRGMCLRLSAAGFPLLVCDVNASAAEDMRTFGDVAVAPAPAAVARACDIVMLSLPGPAEADTVMLDANGILAGVHPGLVVLDTTTIGVGQSRALGEAARAAGLRVSRCAGQHHSPGRRSGDIHLHGGRR